MKTYILLASMLLAAASPVWGQIEDDIYYNPKKEAQKAAASKAARNYIPDFQDIDVDTYNTVSNKQMTMRPRVEW